MAEGGDLAFDEAPERQVGPDGIDVREPGQVADDRADRAAAAPSGRQRVARRVSPADVVRHVAGELQHLVVQEEKAREAELVDQLQLLGEPSESLSKYKLVTCVVA